MGTGYYKRKTERQYKKRAYSRSSNDINEANIKRYETVLAKTKGYDELQRKTREKRGRKKKK